MSFSLPDLPYQKNALAPHISEETINYHYGKHHKTYVDKLNAALEQNAEFSGKSLEEIVKNSSGPIFNNAAQVWNHTFYWHCLSPNGGGKPTGKIQELIEKNFGSFEAFSEKFTNNAINNFGSGWTWLVQKGEDELEIINTSNAETPLTNEDVNVLLTVDVWEHAYYVDYRNARPNYLSAFWNLINWDFVNQNLK
ncbi:superoxide dismutase [Fe] [Paraphotobacterium marinum]|uniref:Superoxide dismutase n=1 Tax=Paraphotobacterium marinum TaxID=1755811 RepID=A0A220VBK8_9GAMM|nr:Fe-Mn family superoxide dismutase [Paraphotobacterium marinum]ASK77709.1 superoxide dismutase [Fe] [Paraphotobacterium marinum]